MHIFADLVIVFVCSSYFYIKFISLWLETLVRWVGKVCKACDLVFSNLIYFYHCFEQTAIKCLHPVCQYAFAYLAMDLRAFM